MCSSTKGFTLLIIVENLSIVHLINVSTSVIIMNIRRLSVPNLLFDAVVLPKCICKRRISVFT